MSWTDGRVGAPCHATALRVEGLVEPGLRVYHLRSVVREGTNRR